MKIGKIALTLVALVLVVAIKLSLSPDSVSAQNTWHVSVSGSDVEGDGSHTKPWRTIQYAIDRAGRGDTIVVGPGTYNEQLNISKSIILTSPTGDYLTSSVVLTGGGSGWALVTVENAASGSVIQGFRFEKVTSSEAVIFGDVGAHDIAVKSNSFVDCAGSAIFLYDTGDRNSYRGWLIANNRVDGIIGTGKAGLWLGTLADSEVTGNTIERINGPAIVLRHVENVTISNNRISNFLVAGILVPETISPRWGSRLFVSSNLINGTAQPSRGQIETPDGIQIVSYVTSVYIKGNALIGNASGCVVSGSEPVASNIHVNFNSIYGNTGYGVQNLSGGQLDATNNWWGASDGPSNTGKGSGDGVSPGVEYEPWLMLKVIAEPKNVVIGGGATLDIVADITQNSRGERTATQGHIFDGTEIVFTTEKGVFDNKDSRVVKTTEGGKGLAVLTSGNVSGAVAVCAEAPHHSVVPSEQYRQCVLVNFVIGAAQSVATPTGTGKAVFASSIGNIARLSPLSESAVSCASRPPNITFLHGLFSFNVVDIAPGSIATVSITLPAPTPKGTQFWQCKPGSGWYQIPIGSDDGDNVITISLADGGMGDLDGIANGLIVVAGGPAVSTQLPVYLQVKALEVKPERVYAGQSVSVRVKLVNKSSVADAYNLVVKIDGQEEHKQTVKVDGGSSLWYEFAVTKTQPGTYEVSIDSKQAIFKVLGPSEHLYGPVSSWLIAVISIVVVVLVGSGLAWWLTHRRPQRTTEQ